MVDNDSKLFSVDKQIFCRNTIDMLGRVNGPICGHYKHALAGGISTFYLF